MRLDFGVVVGKRIDTILTHRHDFLCVFARDNYVWALAAGELSTPNLVGSLSGHKEGSKAFARYRDIDEDMKKELVDLLD